MATLNHVHKKRLAPFVIQHQDTRVLRDLLKSCRACSQTNCDWAMFATAARLGPQIVDELKRREERDKAKPKK